MAASVMLEAALRYASAGLRIIPVRPRGKLPLTQHGAHDATSDEPKIREWWGRWPDANIGMTLAGMVAVDIDPRNGGDADLLPAKLPDTCHAKTGGGGYHYVYRTNGGRFPGHPAPGIDVKTGPGAYIVVEPSVHPSGEKYCWLDESEPWGTPPAQAPSWLATVPDAPLQLDTDGKIAAGGRNGFLTSLAGSARRKGASPEGLIGLLRAENTARCNPPLPDADVQRIAASVGRYQPAEEPPAEGVERHGWPDDIDLSVIAQAELSVPKFVIQDWLPCGYATLFAGHGGVGKSGIGLHISVCLTAGLPFFGLDVQQRRVLYLSCEDRTPILHWRLHHICKHERIGIESLSGKLQIIDLVGHNAVLWERDPRTGDTFTVALAELSERAKSVDIIVVDGVTDTFAGNENARTEVKRYVNTLVNLIDPNRGAVLLLGHIAKPSINSSVTSEGYSGTTGWHNAVRARWYLYPETTQAEDGGRTERTGELILELQKSNLGRMNQEMRFRWDGDAHMFIGEAIGATKLDSKLLERAELDGILRALKGCMDAGLYVPAAKMGQATTYGTLSIRPEFPTSLGGGSGANRRRFLRRIEKLRQMRHIEESEYRRSNRHIVSTIVLTTEGRAECAECAFQYSAQRE